jgi:uncharacterized small protein (DUF1192 family)
MKRRDGCRGETRDGSPCGMARLSGSEFCFAHDPRRGRDRAEARVKGGRNRRTAHGAAPPGMAPSLRSVDAIQGELERAVFDTLLMANSSQRNRTLGYLLGFALRALEVGELEARIAALESMVARGGARLA